MVRVGVVLFCYASKDVLAIFSAHCVETCGGIVHPGTPCTIKHLVGQVQR
jgi:hypothetical protein